MGKRCHPVYIKQKGQKMNKRLREQISNLSDYGIIRTADLIALGIQTRTDPQILEDMAMAMGFKVEGLLQQ